MNTPVLLLIASAVCWVLFFVFVMLWPGPDKDGSSLFEALGMISLIGACLFLGVGIGFLIQDNVRRRREEQRKAVPQGLPSQQPPGHPYQSYGSEPRPHTEIGRTRDRIIGRTHHDEGDPRGRRPPLR